MKDIDIEQNENGVFEVIFFDDNGESILCRTPNIQTAINKKAKFTRYLKEGRLLRIEKSVYKYQV